MKKDKLIMLCLGTILSIGSVEGSDDLIRPTPRWLVVKIGNASIYETEDKQVIVESNSIKTKGENIDLRIIFTEVAGVRTFELFYSLIFGTDYGLISKEIEYFINFYKDTKFRMDIIPFLKCESVQTSPVETSSSDGD